MRLNTPQPTLQQQTAQPLAQHLLSDHSSSSVPLKQKPNEEEDMLRREQYLFSHMRVDIDDYFRTTQRAISLDDGDRFSRHLSQKNMSGWWVLGLTVFISALGDVWLLSMSVPFIQGLAWKNLLSLLYLIPLSIRESRTSSSMPIIFRLKQKQFLMRTFSSAFSLAIWGCGLTYLSPYTSLSEILFLTNLTELWASFLRAFRGKTCSFQRAGQGIIIFGLMFVFGHIIFSKESDFPALSIEVQKNSYYNNKERHTRIIADCLALGLGGVIHILADREVRSPDYFPRYLLLTISSIMAFACCWIGEAAIGFLRLSEELVNHSTLFSGYLVLEYLSLTVITGLGTLISLYMLAQKFIDPTVPALSFTLQPVVASILIWLVGLQCVPAPNVCFGLACMLPGCTIILIASCIFTRSKSIRLHKLSTLEMVAAPQRQAGVLKFQGY